MLTRFDFIPKHVSGIDSQHFYSATLMLHGNSFFFLTRRPFSEQVPRSLSVPAFIYQVTSLSDCLFAQFKLAVRSNFMHCGRRPSRDSGTLMILHDIKRQHNAVP